MSVSNLFSSHWVAKSSTTQHLRIHENEARVDVAARDFWTHGQKAFYDVKVFKPFAKSNQKFALASCFTHHKRQKKRAYEQRVGEVENVSYTPLVFSTMGGMGRLASIFYSRLVTMLREETTTFFINDGMAVMPAVTLPPAIIYTVHQRIKIKSECHPTTPNLHRLGHQ